MSHKLLLATQNGRNLVLGTAPVKSLVIKIGLPAVLAQIINMLYNMVDRMFVGAIPDIGTEALAGLGVAYPIVLVVSAFSSLVGSGGAPLAGIYQGEGDKDKANRVFNNALLLLIILGVVLTALMLIFAEPLLWLFGCPDQASFECGYDYLMIYSCGSIFVLFSLGLNPYITTQGRSLTAMLTVLIGAVLNIALDPLFIFVFGMGIKGAALATVISQFVSFVWVLLFFFSKKSVFRPSFAKMRPNGAIIGKTLSLGLSPFIMMATESAIQVVFNVNLRMYTGGDKTYTAAMTILLSVLSIISLPLSGLGQGIQPIVSYNYGQGNSARVKQTVSFAVKISAVFTVIVYTVSMIFPQLYGYIFNASDSVMALIVKYTPVFIMGTIMFFAQMPLQNCFVALNQTWISLFLACLRKVILLIPLCFLLPLGMGVDGVFWSEAIADLVAGITTLTVFVCMFSKIMRKREKYVAQHNIISDEQYLAQQSEQQQQEQN